MLQNHTWVRVREDCITIDDAPVRKGELLFIDDTRPNSGSLILVRSRKEGNRFELLHRRFVEELE